MNFLHRNSIIHRELKSGNLLINKDGDCVISEFRFSNSLTDYRSKMKPVEQSTIVGSICWMAPEIFENRKYTNKVDVYSFGIMIIELCTGEAPYEKLDRPGLEIIKLILKDNINIDEWLAGYSDELKSLVNLCISKKEDGRLPFEEIESTYEAYFKKA